MKGNFAGVIINRLALNIDKIFDYRIPDDLSDNVTVGSHVFVPFGRGKKLIDGYVLYVKNETDFEGDVKEISSLASPEPLFDREMLDVANHLKETCFCSYISAIKTILPPGSGNKNKTNDKFIRGSRLNLPYDEAFDILETLRTKAPKQAQILEILIQNDFVADSDITLLTGASYAAIKALKEKGYIKTEVIETLRMPLDYDDIKPTKSPKLNAEQQSAVDTVTQAVKIQKSDTFLLHGITGSGKTEVFLNCIENALALGKTAIVLVPEIALTPQMVTRFVSRFGKKIAVLHSALSLGERADEYKRIKRGEATVVVGARSAIFAPLKNIGIIVIDEEHETSYKAENAPTYHARNVADYRAKKSGAVQILASATTSVESYYKALQGEYILLSLKSRATGAHLPEIIISDMRDELKCGNRSCIGSTLMEEIQKNIDRSEQTILFLNRRGFSTFVSCRSCGYVAKCKNCDVTLTYHKHRNTLTCHYCGYTIKKPDKCPECDSKYIKEFGTGTQKVEEELKVLFPDISVIRMDVDTTGTKSSHQTLLNKFSEEKTDILLGTQMVSKGLDFPDVTLVGVLAADQSLGIDDFRANERTFNLITQVCGRAGRGKKSGRAVIQTYMPENQTLELSGSQDYISFYNEEIQMRKHLNFPPFCDMVSVLLTAENELSLTTYSQNLAKDIHKVLSHEKVGGFEILGPGAASIPRIGGKFRQRIWIKCTLDEKTTDIFTRLRNYHIKNGKNINMIIESNPYNTL